MATSGSTNYTVNRNQLVKDALLELGVIDVSEDPTAEADAYASRSLNFLLKNWHGMGLMMHKRTDMSVTLTTATTSYTIGPAGADVTADKPVRVIQAFVRDSSGYDYDVDLLDSDQYYDLVDKSASPSRVIAVWYEPGLTTGTLHVYPGAAAGYVTDVLHLIVHEPYDDMDTGTDEFDMPQEFYRALKFALALEMSAGYRVPEARVNRLIGLSQQAMDGAKAVYSDPVRRIRPMRF